RASAATSRPAWPSWSPPASPGPPPTTPCRSTAATALRWNTPSAACWPTPASSTSSKAPAKSRPRSSPAACSKTGTDAGLKRRIDPRARRQAVEQQLDLAVDDGRELRRVGAVRDPQVVEPVERQRRVEHE